MDPVVQRFTRSPDLRGQRGSVAVVVALSALVLFGFAGIAIDVGRLYINRTELQTAADACALAASAELTCDPTGGACPASFLLNAQAAGIYAAGRNSRDFQVNPVAIAAADVKFYTALAPNANYLSIAGGASNNSRYVMCTASAGGIAPWFMGVFGTGAQTVTSSGVATRAPASSFCNAAPIGICAKPGGYVLGEWITGNFTSNGSGDNTTGGFKWVDFTPGGGGTNEARDQFVGNAGVCNIKVGDTVALPGVHQGIKSAYNTRFGIYPNTGYDATTAPPDHTGYAYPNKAPGSPVISIPTGTPPVGNAYADYRRRQGLNTLADTPFIGNQYPGTGQPASNNIPGNPDTTLSDYVTLGSDRRLVAAPMIDCASGSPTITGMVCVLMLNPMSNGSNGTIYLEYRGLATAAGSPCRVGGLSGGAASSGPQVPTLVQ